METNLTPRQAGFAWHVHAIAMGETSAEDANPPLTPQALDPEYQWNRQVQLMEDEVAAFCASPDQPVAGNGDPVHIGIDSEWEWDEATGRNRVLSYQFHLLSTQGVLAGIVYPKSHGVADRLSFDAFLGRIIQAAMRAELIDAWPRVAFVYAHFLRADVTHFGDFWKAMKGQLDGLRGTVASVKGDYASEFDAERARPYRPEPLVLRDDQRHARRTFVRFIDTLLLTPGGLGLDEAGELIGVPKFDLPAGYTKAEMGRLLRERPADFEAYALRDAEIAVLYGLRMRRFASETLGLRGLPPTIGSLATRLFVKLAGGEASGPTAARAAFQRQFGVEDVEQAAQWHERRKKPVARSIRQLTVHRLHHEAFVTRCYHGGRNETFLFGPSAVGTWNDFDLSGAYTTGLVDLRELDYAGAFETRNVEDFLGHVCGFAKVCFAFASGTRFPCLPVDAGARGLYYPLTGVSYCTAPEIALAAAMGCDLEIERGVAIPWRDGDGRIFEPFVREIRKRRRAAKASGATFDEKLVKEIGNSLYGKLAQGLRPKSHFDPRTGRSATTPASAVTNPYLAAHVTGFIRAVVSELLARLPAHRSVVSVTTDGLLTDATEEEVDLCGPLTRRFQALIDRLDGGGRALERKHRVAQVVSLKTRGCLTAKAVEGEPPILAKASVKPPMRDKAEQNRYMLDLFLNRVPGQTVDQQHLISTREQWATEADLVAITRTLKLNLDFDFKREPVNPSVELVDGAEHLTFETVPWHSAEQGQVMRALFDGWRKAGCLKTLEDFRRWQWFRDVRLHTRGRRVRVGADGAAGLLRKMFLRAYAQGRWGTQKTMNYAEVAQWLTVRGYPTKVDDLKNARRAPLTEGLIPEIPEVMPLWEVLLAEQPNLDRGRFFAAQPGGAAQEPAAVAPVERGSHASV